MFDITARYHSHPGYGCWMSGIDCSTQMLNQQYTEPFIAIVIDPVRTCATGTIEIEAFRTYPPGYAPPASALPKYQTIPRSKVEDFGVHSSRYYPLSVKFFKTSILSVMLDALCNKYWSGIIYSSPLLSNKTFIIGQLLDLKVEIDSANLLVPGKVSGLTTDSSRTQTWKTGMAKKTSITFDSARAAIEHAKGMASSIMKSILFHG